MRYRILASVAVVALLGSGCAAASLPAQDEAEGLLRREFAKSLGFSRFTVSDQGIEVALQGPDSINTIYPARSEAAPSAEDEFWTTPQSFRLKESVAAAYEQLDECGGYGKVNVFPLGGGSFGTETRCGSGEEGESSYSLNGKALTDIENPMSAEGVSTLWQDILEAGAADSFRGAEIVAHSFATVSFEGEAGQSVVWYRDPNGGRSFTQIGRLGYSAKSSSIDVSDYSPSVVSRAYQEAAGRTDVEPRMITIGEPSGGDGGLSVTLRDESGKVLASVPVADDAVNR